MHKEANDHKQKGNEQFKNGEFRESCKTYTQALRICPLAFDKDRAMLYSNRAAAKMKLVSCVIFHFSVIQLFQIAVHQFHYFYCNRISKKEL